MKKFKHFWILLWNAIFRRNKSTIEPNPQARQALSKVVDIPPQKTEWVEAPEVVEKPIAEIEPKIEQLKLQNNMKSRFFNDNTWRNATPSCTWDDMHPEFLARLERTRERANTPFRINSAFRSVEHERSRGRSGNSSHTTGRAVDIACTGSRERFLIIRAAIQEGFTRIGVHPTFIHLDDSPTHDPEVVWFY